MKNLLAIVWLLMLLFLVAALVAPVAARDYPLAQLRSTTSNVIYTATLGTTGGVTATTVTQDVEHVTYHTFQFRVVCTNSVATVIERTLDLTNWVAAHTNTITTTNTGDTTMTGKWAGVRARSIGTNATVTVNYLGQ